jgi:uncharacterized protein (TIGR03382 family)
MFSLLLATFVSPAEAVDLDALLLAWTNTIDGQNGTDGQDEATGVVIDDAGNIIAVGWLDGAVGHGTDGHMIAWNPDGSFGWEVIEDVGEIGADRTSSSDMLHDILLDDATGDIAVCGRRGAEDLTHAVGRYLVERYEEPAPPFGPVFDWEFEYTYGTAITSPINECFGLAWEGGVVLGAGWGVHDPDAGSWLTFGLTESDHIILVSDTYDAEDDIAVPDQAYDAAIDVLTGHIAIVGTRGFSGLEGSLENDTDWHVRYLDPTGTLMWEHTLAGANLLDDRAQSVAIDLVTQDLYVAGWVNNGTDNGSGADLDWTVLRYDDDGDGLGGPLVLWTHTFESEEGASEGATAIHLDDLGDPLVAGWAIDTLTGQEVRRVSKLNRYDGDAGQDWQSLPTGGNSRPAALWLTIQPDKLAIAGTIDSGAGRDFATVLIEQDYDGDGTADSVDACPEDETKAADEGICGCYVPDIDTDGDGVVNCEDECPSDPNKTDPGVCDCDIPDVDTDGDGAFDCDDDCETDPYKTERGECDCNNPDTDTDGDGILGCNDACANTPPGAAIDDFGCPLEDQPDDTGETTDGGGTSDPGCGCSGIPGSAPVAALWFPAIAALVRRRRHSPVRE